MSVVPVEATRRIAGQADQKTYADLVTVYIELGEASF